MSYDAILQVNNYLFLCFVLLECVVPITSNNANLSFEMTNKNNGNSILANNKLLQNDNETQKIELTLVSSNNSSVHDVYQLDESKYQADSWNVTGIQKSLENSFNYSSLISKDDNEKESNLRNNFNNETRNSSSLIKLTTAGDSSLFNKSTTGTLSKEITRIYNINRSNNTERFTKLLFSTKSNIKSTTVKTIHAGTSLHVSKPRHKILRHLNLVPIEDEPFGGVLWKVKGQDYKYFHNLSEEKKGLSNLINSAKNVNLATYMFTQNNSKYVMSVCIPIGVGIAGAACIIGMAYAARRCYKNERKIQEIRAALQQQISATRSDETVLLESSDDDM